MPNYKLTPQADHDLENIFGYGIDTFGVEQAIGYIQDLKARFESIVKTPERYTPVDEIKPGYRRSVCGVHSISTALSLMVWKLWLF